MRGRSYSYSPSPPRDYGRRYRSPSPRGRYGGCGRDLPTSLLVRNLRRDCREPRGFGFVQYIHPADAANAKYHMDGYVLSGQELTVVFAEENRKKPSEMRARERYRGQSYDRRRSPLRYSRSPDYYYSSPRRRRYSRSISPRYRRYRGRSHSRSRSPYGSRSLSPGRSRSWSQSLDYSR